MIQDINIKGGGYIMGLGIGVRRVKLHVISPKSRAFSRFIFPFCKVQLFHVFSHRETGMSPSDTSVVSLCTMNSDR